LADETAGEMVASTVARMVEKLDIYWVAVKEFSSVVVLAST
jgi:hypothetical protein